MPQISQPSNYADPSQVSFIDDFVQAAYNNRIWAVTGNGSVTQLNSAGGRILISANNNNSYRFNHGNFGAFSAAQFAQIIWRGTLVSPATGTGGLSECGFQSATAPTVQSMRWRSARGTTNFQCQCSDGAGTTTVDSGVIANTATHTFQILCSSTGVNFFLDGILRASILTNISTQQLQPFVNCTSSNNAAATSDMDYVDARGVR
jgi:hypothetical protein